MLSTRFMSGAAVAAARVAAILMLALLAVDLGDAWCDPLVPPLESALTGGAAGHADPCTGTCVDDCFCCSSSVTAVRPALPSEPAPTDVVRAPAGASASPGFALPPDHVPLATH
jgi:hypothetical protein